MHVARRHSMLTKAEQAVGEEVRRCTKLAAVQLVPDGPASAMRRLVGSSQGLRDSLVEYPRPKLPKVP